MSNTTTPASAPEPQKFGSQEITIAQTELARVDTVAAGLAELATRYRGVVYDVTTPQGMSDARVARAAIREPRYELEKIRKAAKAPVLALGKKIDAEAERIEKELRSLEDPIDAQIKAEEQRIENERQAAAKAEQERLARIQQRIADIRGAIVTAARIKDPALIAKHIEDVERIEIDESFAESQELAIAVRSETLETLKQFHAVAVEQAEAAERIRRQEEELRQQRERDAAEQRRRDEEARAERERLAAVAREQEAERQRQADEAARIERERLALEATRNQPPTSNGPTNDDAVWPALLPSDGPLHVEDDGQTSFVAPIVSLSRPQAPFYQRPAFDEIVGVLMQHYGAPADVVRTWIVEYVELQGAA